MSRPDGSQPAPLVARGAYAGLQGATLAAHAAAALYSRIRHQHSAPPKDGPVRVLMVAMYPSRFTGTKYRLGIWADRLRRRGFDVELALPLADARAERLANDWSVRARSDFHVHMLMGRLAMLARANRFHAAVIHINDLPFWDRGPPFVATALRRLAGRVILDLDDLPLVAGQSELNGKARALGRLVDGLSVGNTALLEHYPGRPWWYVPTCVEPDEWPVPDRADRSGPPLLGWVGTPGNLRNLEPLAPALAKICSRHGTKLRVVCSERANLPGVPEEFVRWSPEGEQTDLLPMDIGLAPLLDAPKQRYTCGLKALQYMAAGMPVVGSHVGPLPAILGNGETGLLATTPDQWLEALDRLLTDRALRLRLGAAGRTSVEENWSFGVHEASFEDALRGVRPHGGTH